MRWLPYPAADRTFPMRMANAAEDEKILRDLFDAANLAANRLDQMIKEIDGTHAKLQETYAKAMQASSAP